MWVQSWLLSGVTDSVHRVLLETCPSLGPQTAEIIAGICSDQKEAASNFPPARPVMRHLKNACKDKV